MCPTQAVCRSRLPQGAGARGGSPCLWREGTLYCKSVVTIIKYLAGQKHIQFCFSSRNAVAMKFFLVWREDLLLDYSELMSRVGDSPYLSVHNHASKTQKLNNKMDNLAQWDSCFQSANLSQKLLECWQLPMV